MGGLLKLRYLNAKEHAESLGRKVREREKRIEALQVELTQLEASLPMLFLKSEEARARFELARDAYRRWKREHRKGENSQ